MKKNRNQFQDKVLIIARNCLIDVQKTQKEIDKLHFLKDRKEINEKKSHINSLMFQFCLQMADFTQLNKSKESQKLSKEFQNMAKLYRSLLTRTSEKEVEKE